MVLRKLPSLTCLQAVKVTITPRCPYVNSRIVCRSVPGLSPREEASPPGAPSAISRRPPAVTCGCPFINPSALGETFRSPRVNRLQIHPPARLLSAPALRVSRQDTRKGKGYCKGLPKNPNSLQGAESHRSCSRLAPSLRVLADSQGSCKSSILKRDPPAPAEPRWERAGGRGRSRQGDGHGGPLRGPLPGTRHTGPGRGKRSAAASQPYLYAQSRPSSRLSIGRPRSASPRRGARRLGRGVGSPQAE